MAITHRSLIALASVLVASLGVASAAQATTPESASAASCAGDTVGTTSALDDSSAPSGGWHPGPQTVTLTGTGDHMEYVLDCAGAPQSVANGTAVPVPEGVHVISHRAVDDSGNTTAFVDETVMVDTSAPSDNTVSPSGWQTTSTTIVVTGSDSSSGVAKVEWQVDGGAVQTGPNGSAIGVSDDGVHTLRTRVVDNAGNASGWMTHTVRVDTTVPTDTTAPPSGWQNVPTTVVVSGSDFTSGVAMVEWRIDGGAVQTGLNGSAVAMPEGTHTLETRVVDVASNQSSWTAHTVRVDTTAPIDTTAVPAGWSNSRSIALTATDATAGVASWQYQVDGGSTQTLAAGGSVTFPSDGTHTLSRRAFDIAGQASAWSTDTIKIDTVSPVNTSPAAPTAWQTSGLSLPLTGVDANSGFDHSEWRVDGASWQLGSPAVVSDGTHTLETRAVDVAGNASAPRLETVRVDRTAPSVSANCGTDQWRNTAATCTPTANDDASGVAGVTATRSGADPVDVHGATYTVSDDGDWTLVFRAADNVGHEQTTTARVRIDRTPPVPSLTCSPTASDFSCHAAATDSLSGLAGLTWSLDGGAPQAVPADGWFTVTHGSLVVSAVDVAGNTASTAPRTLSALPVTPPAGTTPPPSTNPPPPSTKPRLAPRTVKKAVMRTGSGTGSRRRLGEISLTSRPGGSTADLRPLALGRGTFQIQMRIKADGRSKTVTKTLKIKSGYSPLITVRMRRARHIQLDLTVRRESHSHWVLAAAATAKLG